MEVPKNIGSQIYGLIESLYPYCRSITGDGVRKTLSTVSELIPIKQFEIKTGTKVFDWEIPKEWNIRDAYIKDAKGTRIVDFKKSNLHVVNYSSPVHKKLTLKELKPHLHYLKEYPDWIPYRTTYYNEDWGFCISHNQFMNLTDETYEVCIDSSLAPGFLSYAEYLIKGKTDTEILFFTHICHPSLCNDNLSGIALTAFLAKFLSEQSLHYSYRFVFAPATIGSITWMSSNENILPKIKQGLVVAVCGDQGWMTYKKTKTGDEEIDRAALHVLKHSNEKYDVLEFTPYGYDERQFCSPGINLSMGRLTRTPNGCYPEYHTSADNLELVKPDCLEDSFTKYLSIINIVEHNRIYINQEPKCEPQLGRRGLYRKTGGYQDIEERQYAMLWLLNMSDGTNSLLDIAERSELNFLTILHAANDLVGKNLLRPADIN
jgi:aminopeptidase-like protein